ncbi:MAG: hypothetical protein EZS28_051635, partial [Streblomastix strix]
MTNTPSVQNWRKTQVLPSLNKETQIDLFLQPQEDKKDDQTKSAVTETNSDKKLGKVSFSMIYLSEQDFEKQRKEKELIKKRIPKSVVQEKQIEQQKVEKEQPTKTKQETDKKKKEKEEQKKQQQEEEDKKKKEKELIKKKSESDLIKNREFEEKRKNDELQRIADEEKRIAEEKRKQKEAIDSQYIKGVVQFKNISVRNLKKMDIFSKTDPFVVFKAGEESQQTTVAKSALDYDYLNEEYELIY